MLTDTDALLLVDVQRDFLPGGSLAVPDGDAIVPVLAECVEKFAESGKPIFASRDWHPPGHCSFEEQGGPWPPHCIADTPGAEIHPDLELPDDATIISKATTRDKDAYSAFDGTDLDARLKKLGTKRIFIGGLATDVCVLNTARDALKLGYETVLLEDGMRGIDPAGSQKAIEELRSKHAEVTDSSQALAA